MQQYARAFDADEVHCCAIAVSPVTTASESVSGEEVAALVEFAWSRRSEEGCGPVEEGRP